MEPSVYTHHDGDAIAGDDITVHEIESALKVVLTHSLAHLLTYLLTYSLTHSLTHSLTCSYT